MREIPSITIDDKRFVMPKPKIKLWRRMIRFVELQKVGEMAGEKALDEMLDVVVIAFNNKEVTRDVVEESVDFDDIVKIFSYIREEVLKLVGNKLAQFPNAGTPIGK